MRGQTKQLQQEPGLSGVRLARGQRAGKQGAALPAATGQMLAQPRTEKQQVLSFDLLPAART